MSFSINNLNSSAIWYHPLTIKNKLTNLEMSITKIQQQRGMTSCAYKALKKSYQLEVATRLIAIKLLISLEEYERAEKHIYAVQNLTKGQSFEGAERDLELCTVLLERINQLRILVFTSIKKQVEQDPKDKQKTDNNIL